MSKASNHTLQALAEPVWALVVLFIFKNIYVCIYSSCVHMCTPECHGTYVEIEHAGTGCLLPGGSKDIMQVKVHGKHLRLLCHQTRLYRVQLFLN